MTEQSGRSGIPKNRRELSAIQSEHSFPPRDADETVQYCTYENHISFTIANANVARASACKLQMSSGPNGSSVTFLTKALDEPLVFVRFALYSYVIQGLYFVVRAGGLLGTKPSMRGLIMNLADMAKHPLPTEPASPPLLVLSNIK
jgi:hypothetical protein